MLLITLSLLACGGNLPANEPPKADASPSAALAAGPPAEASPSCGGASQGSASHAPLAAVTRADTRLRTLSDELALPKSTAIELIGLTTATSGQPSQACARYGDTVGLMPRVDVLLLPAQAIALYKNQESAGSPVIVLEREAEKVRVNSQSWFDPTPSYGKIGPDRLLYTPAESALLLGDLPLDRWRPISGDTSAGRGELEQPANVRGLTLPAGVELRWEEGGLWVEATLRQDAQVGGRALGAGDTLSFTQGCEVLLRPKRGGEECLGLENGVMGEPG